MRKITMLLAIVCLLVFSLGAAGIDRSKADKKESNTIVQNEPGTRCTRLSYPKQGEQVEFGKRCTRLVAKGVQPGKILPNQPPTVALSIAKDQPAEGCKMIILAAKSADPDNDQLLFTYSSTGGRLYGEGAAVIWDLTGQPAGTYTSTVEVDDGCGCIAFSSISTTVQ